MFYDAISVKVDKLISSLSVYDSFVESISGYNMIITVHVSRIMSKDFVKLTFNFA